VISLALDRCTDSCAYLGCSLSLGAAAQSRCDLSLLFLGLGSSPVDCGIVQRVLLVGFSLFAQTARQDTLVGAISEKVLFWSVFGLLPSNALLCLISWPLVSSTCCFWGRDLFLTWSGVLTWSLASTEWRSRFVVEFPCKMPRSYRHTLVFVLALCLLRASTAYDPAEKPSLSPKSRLQINTAAGLLAYVEPALQELETPPQLFVTIARANAFRQLVPQLAADIAAGKCYTDMDFYTAMCAKLVIERSAQAVFNSQLFVRRLRAGNNSTSVTAPRALLIWCHVGKSPEDVFDESIFEPPKEEPKPPPLLQEGCQTWLMERRNVITPWLLVAFLLSFHLRKLLGFAQFLVCWAWNKIVDFFSGN
jgi:hypothetical protein